MDTAQQSPPPVRPVTEVISVARLGTAIFSVLALLFSLGALIVANNGDGDGHAAATDAGAVKTSAILASAAIPSDATTVSLKEFAFEPKMVMAQKDSVLKVVNTGAIPHTLTIEGTDIVTPTLNSSDASGISLASLEPGDYKFACTIPGHKAAGMVGDLMVMSDGATHAASGTTSGTTMSADEMDAVMAERTKAFPAKTAGLGAQPLAPTVLADGTKEFDLTASDRRLGDRARQDGRRPGPTTAPCPGPTLRVEPGRQGAGSSSRTSFPSRPRSTSTV